MPAEKYKEMGAYLKDCREGLGYKIVDIAKQLNIRERYIRAIEDGTFENLPGNVYTEGYLKNYAKYLKLDPKKILEMYRLGGANDDKVEETFTLPVPQDDGLRPNTLILIGSALAIGLVYYWWYSNQDFEKAEVKIQEKEVSVPFVQETKPLSEADIAVIGVISGRVGVESVSDKEMLHGLDQDSQYHLPGETDQAKPEEISLPVSEKKVEKPKPAEPQTENLGWKTENNTTDSIVKEPPPAPKPVKEEPKVKEEENIKWQYPRRL